MFAPRNTSYLIVGVLALAATLAFSEKISSAVRWFIWSHSYKAKVLRQAYANDEFRHVQWDQMGWAGQNTTEYLVFDPTDSLLAAAQSGQPGKFAGVPCDVARVRQLETNWYRIQFYTNETWGQRNALDCRASAY
jgi:hypothetical protein